MTVKDDPDLIDIAAVIAVFVLSRWYRRLIVLTVLALYALGQTLELLKNLGAFN